MVSTDLHRYIKSIMHVAINIMHATRSACGILHDHSAIRSHTGPWFGRLSSMMMLQRAFNRRLLIQP